MIYASLLLASTVAYAGGGISLSGAGSCPGDVDITITGATPGGSIAYLFGLGAGADVIPAGPCAGTVTGLAGLRWGFARPEDTGAVTWSPTLPDGVCSRSLQVLDVTTCTLSGVLDMSTLGGPEPAGGRCTPVDVLWSENADAPPAADTTTSHSNTLMVPFVPDAEITLDGAQIWTGESAGNLTLGVYADDGAGVPGVLLTTGTSEIVGENQWQGPVFDAPITLSAGVLYWFAMMADEDYQTSYADFGAAGVVEQDWLWTPPDWSVWNGPYTNAWMYKLVTCE
ncbi:MAG: hypothetical protein ACI8PZ_007496 [Myxococcota bacterium]